MHEDEVHIDAALVRRLLYEQFPALASLPISPSPSIGTVNAVYRIGDDLCARLPRVARAVADLERERQWLPWLASRLPLPIPEPVGEGRADDAYPFAWALYRWLEGDTYSDERVVDEAQAAQDLAEFVLALRRLDPAGAPRAGRRPLRQLDAATRTAIAAAREFIDAEAALAAWDESLETPVWEGEARWIHTDLLRSNILTGSGRISAVIDFGAAGVGDPAADLIAAWSVFGPTGREVFRSIASVDPGTWQRARGFALHQAALIIPYYADTNPGFAASAQRTVEQVLLDVKEGRSVGFSSRPCA
jgi:aminoglycoside phosphotransferase (APT) family kinase protein